MIDETEYKIARQWRLTGGAGVPPEQVSPPSQRSLQATRRSSPKRQQHTNGDSGRNDEGRWSSDTDDENERHDPMSGRPKRSEVASMSRRREQMRMMLSTADIAAVERTIDEHAGHADAELQELRQQLIQHREVSEYY